MNVMEFSKIGLIMVLAKGIFSKFDVFLLLIYI